jgi:hypothetical protein
MGHSPQKAVVIEPRTRGRWYEIGEDGSKCDWGEVLAWEPPARLLLAWRIGADWRFDPNLLAEIGVSPEPVVAPAPVVPLKAPIGAHRRLFRDVAVSP